MANIKKIELVDIKYWSSAGLWATMKGKKGETVADLTALVLYSDVTGFDPTEGYNAVLKWDDITVGADTGYTIFGATDGLIPVDTPSIRIRYKIKTTSAGSPDTEVTTTNYYYQMINFSVPETGVVAGLPAAISGGISALISINVPGFNAAMAGSDSYQTMMNYMKTAAAWEFTWGISDGEKIEVNPSALAIGTPVTTDVAEYGGCRIQITAKTVLPVSTSGTYVLSVNFIPNDDGSALTMGSMTTTATVTVNMATQGDATYFSDDSGLVIKLSFTA